MSVIIALLVGAAAVVVLAAALWPRSVHIVIEKQRSYPPIERRTSLPPSRTRPRARILTIEMFDERREARVSFACDCRGTQRITRAEQWFAQRPRPAVFCRGCDQLVMEARP